MRERETITPAPLPTALAPKLAEVAEHNRPYRPPELFVIGTAVELVQGLPIGKYIDGIGAGHVER